MKLLPLVLAASALLLQGAIAQRGGGRGRNRETPAADVWRFLVKKYDKNNNRKITWEEYKRDKVKFQRFDKDKNGFLSKEDFKAEDGARNAGRRGGRGRARDRDPQKPDGPIAPRIGQKAPDFELPLAKSPKKTLKLSSFAGKKPVALIFGSYTLPPFVASAFRVRKLYSQYRSKVEFVFVYVREAHAIDSESPMGRIKLEDPMEDKERQHVAKTCAKKLKLSMPAVVDKLDDKIAKAYGGIPDRLYLIDKEGRISYAGGLGPEGFMPDELEDAIRELLEMKPVKRKEKTEEERPRRGGR